jgi:aminopeptidase N
MRSENPPVIRLEDYRAPDYLIDRVDLDISLHATDTVVRSVLNVRPNPNGRAGAPLKLDGEDIALVGLHVNGAALNASDYELTPEHLTLLAPPGEAFILSIETRVNPSANTKLMGLYRSNGTYCTQCEADGFRRITYFMDRPDVMSVYRVRLEADKAEAPILLSNGNPVESADVPGGQRHYAVWHDPHRKPCYLFALVAGDLGRIEDRFNTKDGRDVTLAIYTEKGKEALADYAMDALKRSMRWDETAFDRAYDLDVFNIVAVSDFNMGAMENKGLNIFNDKYVLASPETATDTDYLLIEAIIAHEYFHNWTGNRITCRDWFQLCLKEGLTVFRDQEFTSDMRSRAVKRIADVKELRARQFPEDAGPLAHPVRPSAYKEINNFYTATVYEKGAEVIRMLKAIIGADAFRRGMDLYFERHDGEAATVEQFIACFAKTSGEDLTQFMRWYEQAGTPQVTVERSYDASKHRLSLTFTQETKPTPGQSEKLPLVIPIALGIVSPAHADAEEQDSGVFVLTKTRDTISLEGIEADAVPSILRGFSAPVNLVFDVSDRDLLALSAHDADPFNRWQALQTLATRVLVNSVESIRQGEPPLIHEGLAQAVQRLLDTGERDPAFTALAVGLPSVDDLMRDIGRDVDPDAIFASRKALATYIARHCLPGARALYDTLAHAGPYSPDATSAGRRMLRNAALTMILQADLESGGACAYAQFTAADNMTDRMAGLAGLTLYGAPQRDQALQSFETQFSSSPLVMDKWFALQAMVPEHETLARVKSLMTHPAFTMANPNRVRSLIGAFAMSNPTQFHRPDGAGYEFVAEQIAALDSRNPQVAARILTAFRSWRTLDAARSSQARHALSQIAKAAELSRDVADILERTLA